ncbi:MAG: hypothetical protein WCB92_17260 [Mycobacterium sp.]
MPGQHGTVAVGARVATPQAVADAAAARFDARGVRRAAAGRLLGLHRGESPVRALGALPVAGPVFDVVEAQLIDRRSPG